MAKTQEYDEDDDTVVYDDDDEDMPPIKKKSPPSIQPKKEEKKDKEDFSEYKEPQILQIPRIVTIDEMLNIIYEQNTQILNLLNKEK